MNITFRQLRVFTEVARHASMAKAAEAKHLTPQAVSMLVRELESQVGLTLFDRSGRSVSLSTAGEYFLVHAKRLLATLKDAENAMARFKKLESALLNVGMISTAGCFLPRLLALFRRDHPGVDVRLHEALTREGLMAMMRAGDVDLAVMGRPPKDAAARAETFASNPMVFFCAPDHPLLAAGHPPASVLEPWPLIARQSGSGTRNAMNEFLGRLQFEPRLAMELASNEAVKQTVMAGLGVGFLPLLTLATELRAGALRRLDIEGTPVVRTWNVVHLHSKVLSPAAEALRYFAIEHGEAMLGEEHRALLRTGPPG